MLLFKNWDDKGFWLCQLAGKYGLRVGWLTNEIVGPETDIPEIYQLIKCSK